MQSLEFTSIPSSETEEATRMVRRRRRSRSIPLVIASASASALLVSVLLLYLLVDWREQSPASLSSVEPSSSSSSSSSVSGNVVDTAGNETNHHLEDPKTPSCNNYYYDCQTDRLGHKTLLLTGQAICNHQYRFGLTSDGIFQWHDCDSNEIRIIAAMDVNDNDTDTDTVQSLQLDEDGTFQLFGRIQKNLLWQKASTFKNIHFRAECLKNHPVLDCPYLHLHKSGDVVLNWIDDSGKWMARNIQRCYDDLFAE